MSAIDLKGELISDMQSRPKFIRHCDLKVSSMKNEVLSILGVFVDGNISNDHKNTVITLYTMEILDCFGKEPETLAPESDVPPVVPPNSERSD